MNKKITFNQIIPEKRCKKCGKKFIPAPEHRFREYSAWYCTWTCYLHRRDKEIRRK